MKRHGEIDPFLANIIWGEQHGAFDSDLGRSLLRAYSVGAHDDAIVQMIAELIAPLKRKDARGHLLPFKRPRLRKREILLGRDHANAEVRVPVQSLAAGLLLAANTGAGKTNLLSHLVLQVAATGCKVWLSDMYKTQLRHLAPGFQQRGQHLVILRPQDWRFNLLQPQGNPRTHLATAVDLLVRCLGLPPRSRVILSQGCHALYTTFNVFEGQERGYPCLFDLHEWILNTAGLNAAAREAILDRLGSLLATLTPRTAAYRHAWTPDALAAYSICFEMRGASETAKQLLLEPLLYSVMSSEIERGSVNAKINLFVAFEDGQRFFANQTSSSGLTPMDEIAGVIRGSGKGLGIIVQTLEGFSPRLLPNLATKIMGRLGSHKDYTRLGADLAMDRKQIEWARKHLKPGIHLLQASDQDWREPTLIHVPHLKIPPGVTDEHARQSIHRLKSLPLKQAKKFAHWTPERHASVTSRENKANEHVRQHQASARHSASGPLNAATSQPNHELLPKDQLDYLCSIAREPLLKLTERDRRLQLSAWKGDKLRKQLIKRGLVRTISVNPGGRGKRFQLLELTKEGRDLLRTHHVKPKTGLGRGGLQHQWWVHTITEWLTARVATCTVEDESHGARVDIAATLHDGRTLAIEVETSTGHEKHNIEKDLCAGYDIVISLTQHSIPATSPRDKDVRIADLQDFRTALTKILALPETNSEPQQGTDQSDCIRRRPRDLPHPKGEPLGAVLDTKQAAAYLGLSPRTLESWRNRGAGPHSTKLGRRVIYQRSHLDDWLEAMAKANPDSGGRTAT